jgi:alcohol dehydrogenase (NADP+)
MPFRTALNLWRVCARSAVSSCSILTSRSSSATSSAPKSSSTDPAAVRLFGGLGHLAVKFAKAMGAEVAVLSQSLKKMEDGLRLGADHYYATSGPDIFTTLAGSFDLVVNTVSARLNMGDYLGLLVTGGTLVELGMPGHPLEVPAFPLAAGRRSIAGSLMGGIPETQEMLDFCAEHDVVAEIEVITPDYINEAYTRVLASDVRYRFVIDTSSLRENN